MDLVGHPALVRLSLNKGPMITLNYWGKGRVIDEERCSSLHIPCSFIRKPGGFWFSIIDIQLLMQPQNDFNFNVSGVLTIFHVDLNTH